MHYKGGTYDLEALKNELSVQSCKRILFEMYHDVETSQYGSRSLYGDKVLELQQALYEDGQGKVFYDEYAKYCEKMGYSR